MNRKYISNRNYANPRLPADNNFSPGSNRNTGNKRKHEYEEPVIETKRPYLSESSRNVYSSHQNDDSSRFIFPHSPRQIQLNLPHERNRNQLHRYSANFRLQNLRRNLNEQPASGRPNKSPRKADDLQVQVSSDTSGRNFVVTAKPSSLEERLRNIRNSKSCSSSLSSTNVQNRLPSPCFAEIGDETRRSDGSRSYTENAEDAFVSDVTVDPYICNIPAKRSNNSGSIPDLDLRSEPQVANFPVKANNYAIPDVDLRSESQGASIAMRISKSGSIPDTDLRTGPQVASFPPRRSNSCAVSDVDLRSESQVPNIPVRRSNSRTLPDVDLRSESHVASIPVGKNSNCSIPDVDLRSESQVASIPVGQTNSRILDVDLRSESQVLMRRTNSRSIPDGDLRTEPDIANLPSGSITPLTIDDDISFMDWSYSNEQEVLTNIQQLRKDISKTVEPQTPFQEVIANGSSEIPHNATILKDIYIVVDTNIFIAHLNILKKLLEIKINVSGVATPIILVPWMVIQELDYIKDGRHENKLRGKAQTAINFINECLLHNRNQIKGQSIRDAAQQDFSSKNADDGILHCCLQVVKKRNRAMLLSNDTNLRNKAMISGVASYSHKEIIRALDPFSNSSSCKTPRSDSSAENSKQVDVKTHVSHLCSYIILKELRDSFGVAWSKMRAALKNPPWTLEECLELFQKYWQSVFSLRFQKQCLNHIAKFSDFLRNNTGIGKCNNSTEMLIEFSLALCVYLKNGFPLYSESIDNCVTNINIPARS